MAKNVKNNYEKYLKRGGFLYNIQEIENVESIMKYGLLSHNEAINIKHIDISNSDVQNRRERKTIDDVPLHDYANVYFDYWNPMLSRKRDINDKLAILVISPDILNIKGCLVSDKNAAVDDAKFYAAEIGYLFLDFKAIYYNQWFFSAKQIKQAEVLVPNKIDSKYIEGIIVYNYENKTLLEKNKNIKVKIECKPECFFEEK